MSKAAISWRCIGCRATFGRGFEVCTGCGMQNSSIRVVGPSDEEEFDGDPCQALNDYDEEEIERIPVCEPWNSLLSGPDLKGMPMTERGMSCLVFGRKGTFKTSLLLRLAASVKNSVWVPKEDGMGPVMLKAYAERMGLNLHDSLRVVESGSLTEMASAVRARKRTLVVIDSISEFEHPLSAFRAFREASPGAALFAVVQVNKRGQMTGEERLGHAVDIVVKLTATTLSTPQKNRFGALCSVPNPEHKRSVRAGRPRVTSSTST